MPCRSHCWRPLIVISLLRIMASAGDVTGWTSCGTPTRPVRVVITRFLKPISTEITSSTPSIAILPTINFCVNKSPVTCCQRPMKKPVSARWWPPDSSLKLDGLAWIRIPPCTRRSKTPSIRSGGRPWGCHWDVRAAMIINSIPFPCVIITRCTASSRAPGIPFPDQKIKNASAIWCRWCLRPSMRR